MRIIVIFHILVTVNKVPPDVPLHVTLIIVAELKDRLVGVQGLVEGDNVLPIGKQIQIGNRVVTDRV